jgi:hypothetical protein
MSWREKEARRTYLPLEEVLGRSDKDPVGQLLDGR